MEATPDRSADLPLGECVEWSPVAAPSGKVLRGERVILRPFDLAADAESLYAATRDDPAIWTYLRIGPFADARGLHAVLEEEATADGYVFYAIEPTAAGRARGQAGYMRIDPANGTIEIGSIFFAAGLRRTAAATEAIFLLARHVFDDLGYRRLEWKCNALNAPSRRAAERFGFRFEGIFRKDEIIKGHNRDTAWFSIVDDEWPAVRAAFEAWLDPANFAANGSQKRSLAELTAGH
ncbi:MAG: GNAT family N-acetyltransferase [Actinobacteria bacterium]|nr:GNAT family N-acetyltransferase [Actinomycetota bacterium]